MDSLITCFVKNTLYVTVPDPAAIHYALINVTPHLRQQVGIRHPN